MVIKKLGLGFMTYVSFKINLSEYEYEENSRFQIRTKEVRTFRLPTYLPQERVCTSKTNVVYKSYQLGTDTGDFSLLHLLLGIGLSNHHADCASSCAREDKVPVSTEELGITTWPAEFGDGVLGHLDVHELRQEARDAVIPASAAAAQGAEAALGGAEKVMSFPQPWVSVAPAYYYKFSFVFKKNAYQ